MAPTNMINLKIGYAGFQVQGYGPKTFRLLYWGMTIISFGVIMHVLA